MAQALRPDGRTPSRPAGRWPASVRARPAVVAGGLGLAVLAMAGAGWLGAVGFGADPASARGTATAQAVDAPAGLPPPVPAPVPVVASGPGAASVAPQPAERTQVREAVAQRIDALHRKLRITPSEQSLWDQFADTMLRNALDSEGRFRARQTRPEPDAAEGLADRAQAAQSRADMLQHLSASFRPLYEAMTPDQRLAADKVFRQAQRQEGRTGSPRVPQD